MIICNINLVFNKHKNISIQPSLYMNVASYNSFISNSHGEGMFGLRNKHTNVFKSIFKLIYRQQYWLLASHQRLATSGKHDDLNTQPIITKDFFVLHNGVFSDLGDKTESDTVVYSRILQKKYDESKDVIKAIQETHKIVKGWYSVILYHKGKGKLYYYKDNKTSIYFIENKDWFILSTKKDNVFYAQRFFKIGGEIKEIDTYKIYNVLDGMAEIGTIAHKEPEPIQQQETLFYPYKWNKKPQDEDYAERWW